MTGIAPLRPVPPFGAPPMRRRHLVGVLLVVAGALLLVASVVALGRGGLAAFLPSDPATGQVGFTAADDGQTRLVVDPVSARQVVTLELFTGDPYDDGNRPVWVAERPRAGTGGWADDLRLGQIPPGFVVTTDRGVPTSEITGVMITNGCYGGPDLVPDPSTLRPGVVRAYDADVPLAEYLTSGTGFTSCDDPDRTAVLSRTALVLGASGLAAVLVGTWTLGVVRRARHPVPGWYDDPEAGGPQGGLRWWDGGSWTPRTAPWPSTTTR